LLLGLKASGVERSPNHLLPAERAV